AASAEPSASASASSTSEVLSDGRHPAYLTKVNAGDRQLTFDVIQFLTGDEAIKAAKEDGVDGPPNDYYIRNVNPALRTLPVSSDATITVNTLEAENTGDSTKDVTVTLEKLGSYQRLSGVPFWLTVKDGVITAIAEQFVP